jgi:hypothetical protein
LTIVVYVGFDLHPPRIIYIYKCNSVSHIFWPPLGHKGQGGHDGQCGNKLWGKQLLQKMLKKMSTQKNVWVNYFGHTLFTTFVWTKHFFTKTNNAGNIFNWIVFVGKCRVWCIIYQERNWNIVLVSYKHPSMLLCIMCNFFWSKIKIYRRNLVRGYKPILGILTGPPCNHL